jgi:hypothetical protein
MYSLRVHWILFVPFFSQAWGLRPQSLSCCARFSRAQTTMPLPTLPYGIGISLGSPLPTLHLPLHPQRSLPCSTCRTQTECFRWRIMDAPSTLCGSSVFPRGNSGLPVLPFALPYGCNASVTTPNEQLVSCPLTDISGKVCPGGPSPKGFIRFLLITMAFLNQALLIGYLPSPHSAFQDHAAHPLRWFKELRSKGSGGTCILPGISAFLHVASRRTIGWTQGPRGRATCGPIISTCR